MYTTEVLYQSLLIYLCGQVGGVTDFSQILSECHNNMWDNQVGLIKLCLFPVTKYSYTKKLCFTLEVDELFDEMNLAKKF